MTDSTSGDATATPHRLPQGLRRLDEHGAKGSGCTVHTHARDHPQQRVQCPVSSAALASHGPQAAWHRMPSSRTRLRHALETSAGKSPPRLMTSRTRPTRSTRAPAHSRSPRAQAPLKRILWIYDSDPDTPALHDQLCGAPIQAGTRQHRCGVPRFCRGTEHRTKRCLLCTTTL